MLIWTLKKYIFKIKEIKKYYNLQKEANTIIILWELIYLLINFSKINII